MYKLIENIITVEKQIEIQNYFFSAECTWQFNRFASYKFGNTEVDKEKVKRLLSFRRSIFQNNAILDKKAFPLIKPIMDKVEADQLYNIICQLYLPIIDIGLRTPHIDMPQFPRKYYSAVYYVNDSDGPTCLMKQTKDSTLPEDIKLGKYEVGAEIIPRQGNLLVFDGDRYHCATPPKQDIRCIINFCFTSNSNIL